MSPDGTRSESSLPPTEEEPRLDGVTKVGEEEKGPDEFGEGDDLFPLVLVGENVQIRATGKFARVLAAGFSGVMAVALAEPDDQIFADLQKVHPEWEDRELKDAIPGRREAKAQLAMKDAVQTLMADQNLLYRLTAAAIGKSFEWTEENVTPKEVGAIVERCFDDERFGIEDYLGKLPSLLTRMVPGSGAITDEEASLLLSESSGRSAPSSDAHPESSTD